MKIVQLFGNFRISNYARDLLYYKQMDFQLPQ